MRVVAVVRVRVAERRRRGVEVRIVRVVEGAARVDGE